MTLNEAEKIFAVSLETLKKYVSYGFFTKENSEIDCEEYQDMDFDQLGLIDTLLGAGFNPEEVKHFLNLIKRRGTDIEQIQMLRKQRRSLLNDIHNKQQILDKLDFMIRK